jgi:general secretion pathway protein I
VTQPVAQIAAGARVARVHAPAGRTLFARRAVPRFERSRGFTLMELIAAFVIFALGFGILLQILGSALHTTRQSAEYTQAALWAQSLLDSQGIGEPLKEGGRSGQFDDQFSYVLNVSKYQPIPVTSNNNLLQASQVGAGAVVTPGQMELYQLELVVSWGNEYLMHHARFVTLRVMGPPRTGGPVALPGFGG